MDKTLCFVIENKKIYLEQVLVEYMGVPIFFVCNDEKQRYLVLCTDVEELQYYVTLISQKDMFDLLHGNVSMRNVFLMQNEFWTVLSGETPVDDIVMECSRENIDYSVLPEENAVFEVLTKDIAEYVKKFDADFWIKEYNSMLTTKTDESSSVSSLECVEVAQYEDIGGVLQAECSVMLDFVKEQYIVSRSHEWLMNNNSTCAA